MGDDDEILAALQAELATLEAKGPLNDLNRWRSSLRRKEDDDDEVDDAEFDAFSVWLESRPNLVPEDYEPDLFVDRFDEWRCSSEYEQWRADDEADQWSSSEG